MRSSSAHTSRTPAPLKSVWVTVVLLSTAFLRAVPMSPPDAAVWRIAPPSGLADRSDDASALLFPPLPAEFLRADVSDLEAETVNVTSTTAALAIRAAAPTVIAGHLLQRAELESGGVYGHHQHNRRSDPHAGGDGRSPASGSASTAAATAEAPLDLAAIPVVAPSAEFTFHANESLAHVRTDNWMLNFGTCLEVRFRLEGKRTRLLIYTCQMTEGGMCTLDKFSATGPDRTQHHISYNRDVYGEGPAGNGASGNFGTMRTERCMRLRPWMHKAHAFAFHFRFVRRPRRYGDSETELRVRRRRLGRRAVREVGRVTLKGFKKCSKTCVQDASGGAWLDGGQLAESDYSTAKYDERQRRRRRRRRSRHGHH